MVIVFGRVEGIELLKHIERQFLALRRLCGGEDSERSVVCDQRPSF